MPARPSQPVPWHRNRRRVRDAPARHCSRRYGKRICSVTPGAPEQQRNRVTSFGCKLEPARLSHLHAPGLPDDGSQPPMPQSVLQQCQQFCIVARLGIDDPGGCQARLVQAGGKQIARSDHPENISGRAGGDTCCEEDCGSIVSPAGAERGELMQGVEP